MSKAKWYNPTHNPIWDEYYAVALVLWLPILLLLLLIIGAACYNTFVRHLS